MKIKRAGKSKAPGKASPQPQPPEEAVDRYLKSLVHPFKAEIEALRSVILEADSRISEGVKWNAPSFYCGDWFATFNLRSKDSVQIIFHRGAKVKSVGSSQYVEDPSAMLKWITNDRCVAIFTDLIEVQAKAARLKKIVVQWVNKLAAEAAQT